jgi:hypothetical protein
MSLKHTGGTANKNAEAGLTCEGGKTESQEISRSHTTTEYSVESGGPPTKLQWIFRSKDSAILKGGLQNQLLGQINKTGSPCQIEADCRAESKDIVITDTIRKLAKSINKSKLLKALLLPILQVSGLQSISLPLKFYIE